MTGTLEICRKTRDIEFRDVCYVRCAKHGLPPREILQNVYGQFRSGRLTAILGPSGAGKTSLLNILSGFRTIGVKGRVLVNGLERVPQVFRKECCYITQEFAMLGLLTVFETFKTTADLKLGSAASEEEKLAVISDVADILHLKNSYNTQVRHLSGGEKKRLSIGVELLTNPPVMFFDEPTSGLDSSSSTQVISHLKTLANGGRTVVCVIHQPSSRLFEMFDDVFLLADGRTVYYGAMEDMVPDFETAGFTCPNYYNRADFAIEVISKERGDNIDTLLELTRSKSDKWNSIRSKTRENGLDEHVPEHVEVMQPMLPGESFDTKIDIPPKEKIKWRCTSGVQYPVSTYLLFWILLKRSFICSTIRDQFMAQTRLAAQLVVGLLMGVVFYDLGNEASKVQSNTSYLFFSLMFIFFSNAMPTVQTFPAEAAVFMREHLNNWYSVRAYYFSKLVADLPLQIICPTTYLVITYYLTSQPMEFERCFKVLLLGVVLTMMAQALGHVFGAAFNAELGTFLIPASAIPMFLFSGFFILLSDLPKCLYWISYFSYFRYPFEGLMLAIYGDSRETMQCSVTLCFFKSPERFLKSMDLADGNYWVDIAGMVTWTLFLRIAFLCVLRWKVYRVRGY